MTSTWVTDDGGRLSLLQPIRRELGYGNVMNCGDGDGTHMASSDRSTVLYCTRLWQCDELLVMGHTWRAPMVNSRILALPSPAAGPSYPWNIIQGVFQCCDHIFPQISFNPITMHSSFLLGFTHTPASYTSMASNIRNRPITPGLLYVLPIGVA